MEVLERVLSVFIIEDLELIRDGLTICLSRHGLFHVLGSSSSVGDAMDAITKEKPDVILLDIGLGGDCGIESIDRLRTVCDSKIVMFTGSEQAHSVMKAIAAGADGYCLKGSSREVIALAIKSAAAGALWFDPRIENAVRDACRNSKGRTSEAHFDMSEKLSAREKTVLELLSRGLSNKEIGKELQISFSTVRTHVDHIMEKLNASCRTDAVAKAIRVGLAC